jgi:hypothetical protein
MLLVFQAAGAPGEAMGGRRGGGLARAASVEQKFSTD